MHELHMPALAALGLDNCQVVLLSVISHPKKKIFVLPVDLHASCTMIESQGTPACWCSVPGPGYTQTHGGRLV